MPHKQHLKLEPLEGSFVAKLKAASGIPFVAQDRFHVMHNAGQFFNNFDPRYRPVCETTIELRARIENINSSMRPPGARHVIEALLV